MSEIKMEEVSLELVVDFGEAEGVQAGYKEGYKDGEADGHADGYQEGHTAGYSEGYGKGEADGTAAGHKAEHDKMWDVFQKNGDNATKNNYAPPSGYFGTGRFTFDNFYPKYDIKPIGNAQFLFYAWEPKYGNVVGSLTQRLKECGVVLDTSKATDLSQMFNYSRFTEIPTIDFSSVTAACSGCFANHYGTLKTIEKIVVHENLIYNSWFTNDTALENVRFEGVIGQNGLDFSPCKKLTYDSCHSIFTHLKDFSEKIVDRYTYIYDGTPRQILGTHTLVAGAEYSLYYSNPMYIDNLGTAIAKTIKVPNVGDVLGLQYDFSHPAGPGYVLTKYIYQSGDHVVLYEDENAGNCETIVSLTKAPTETVHTITMPKAVRDNGNATQQDIAEATQKGWTIAWL